MLSGFWVIGDKSWSSVREGKPIHPCLQSPTRRTERQRGRGQACGRVASDNTAGSSWRVCRWMCPLCGQCHHDHVNKKRTYLFSKTRRACASPHLTVWKKWDVGKGIRAGMREAESSNQNWNRWCHIPISACLWQRQKVNAKLLDNYRF